MTLLDKLGAIADRRRRQEIIDLAATHATERTIANTSLDGQDLSGLYLAELDIIDVDFRGAICRGVSFPPLIRCILDSVNAMGASFTTLEDCRLRSARLSGAYLGPLMTDCDFSDSNLEFARVGQCLKEQESDYRGNTFERANLHAFDGAGTYLAGTHFAGARLTNARLSRADLTRCDFRDADLSGANLVDAHFMDSDARGAVFDKCVVAPRLRKELQAGYPQTTKTLRDAEFKPSPRVLDLERELEGLPEYSLRWDCGHAATARMEKLGLTKDEIAAGTGAGGVSFRSDDVCLRTYSSVGPHVVTAVFLDMAADYANWQIDLESTRVRIKDRQRAARVEKLLREVLTELFSNG